MEKGGYSIFFCPVNVLCCHVRGLGCDMNVNFEVKSFFFLYVMSFGLEVLVKEVKGVVSHDVG